MDSKVHDLQEMQKQTGLTEDQVTEVLKFMAEFRFVMFDEPSGSVAAVLPIKQLLSKRGML